jgi:hypothetical protein
VYSAEKLSMLVTQALQSESPTIIANTIFALATFYQSLFQRGKPVEGAAVDLLHRLPDSLGLITNCLDDNRISPDHYPVLLGALADIVSATAEWISAGDRERLFSVFWKAYHEIQVTFLSDDIARRKEEIAFANQMFAMVFKGFTAVLQSYKPNDPLLRDHKVMRLYMIDPPRRFLSIRSFTPASLLAFYKFLDEFNQVYGRNGNILLNRNVNFQLLAHGFALENIRVKQTVERTWQMLLKA